MKTRTIILLLLPLLFSCGKQAKEEVKSTNIKKDTTILPNKISVADIQKLIDFIKANGFEIKILEPITRTKYIFYSGPQSNQYNDLDPQSVDEYIRNNICIYENDTDETIYSTLLRFKELIEERNRLIKAQIPNPTIKRLKL